MDWNQKISTGNFYVLIVNTLVAIFVLLLSFHIYELKKDAQDSLDQMRNIESRLTTLCTETQISNRKAMSALGSKASLDY